MGQIHLTACVDKTAEIGSGVTVGANCVIESGAVIGDDCYLDAGVIIGKDVVIGKGNNFYPHCVIGRNPQGLGIERDGEYGSLVIGDNNVIREQVTIHPSLKPGTETRIGNENFIMIGVHVGHDVIMEDKAVISNFTQISGHCKIETGVWLSGMVQIHQFVTISKWVYAAGFAGLNHDVPPFVMVSGHYPPVVRAVNKRGLGRAGISEEGQANIQSAFKKLFREDDGEVLLERAKSLADEDIDENVRAMCDAIIHSHEHRYGRYLELFRD